MPVLNRPEDAQAAVSRQTDSSSSESGGTVLQEVANLTGLSADFLDSEICEVLGTTGNSVKEMSVDQLRAAMLNLLEAMNQEITGEKSSQAGLSEDPH